MRSPRRSETPTCPSWSSAPKVCLVRNTRKR